jgi:hypothetical protein
VAAACLLRRSLVCRAAGDYYGSTAGLISIRSELQWPWFGQFQDRRAPLVAELLADGREQPLAPVTGVIDRQSATIGGIDRPHVPDLMTPNINQRHGPGRRG